MILASTIYNSYPYALEMDIDPPEEKEPFDVWFQRVREDLPGCGDALFRYLLIELFEGGEMENGTFTDDPAVFVRLLKRSQDDIQKVIEALKH